MAMRLLAIGGTLLASAAGLASTAAVAQSPSPRACETARRQGVRLSGCPSRRVARPAPPTRRVTPPPPTRPRPPIAPGPEQIDPAASVRAAQMLFGTWKGIALEPRSATRPQYPVSVRIEPDVNGLPFGMVTYETFPCRGVWNSGGRRGAAWRFQETITEGRDVCALHVVVELELTPDGQFINILLYPNGYESTPSRGTLHREE